MKTSITLQRLVVLLPLVIAFASLLTRNVAAQGDVTSLAASSPAKQRRPNVVFILTDDQGYGDLGRHGHPLLKTPHTDRLFDESVRFDNFYVSPSCSPTRAALMTGMHEFRGGVTHTILPREHLDRGAITLPQLLRDAGYRTGFIGKWHLGGGVGYAPQFRGFDWTSTNAGGPRVHFNPTIIRNGVRKKREGFREDLFFDEAMSFIDESGDRPFFCYLATYSPHTPLDAPEKFIAPFRGKVTDEQATYLGMVANVDDNVGRLLEFLRERDLHDNTIVIFMNDNGQTKGLDVYNAGMRGCKCTIWEGGCRAMSLWRWPGRWQPHTVDNLTAHLDVLPTVCDLAGVAIPDELQPKLDGFSLRPLLESDEPVTWHEDRMLFHHVARWPSGMAASHKYAMCGVRQGHYLLLRSRPCDDSQCTPQIQGNQCHTLRNVERGATTATYTANNAQFHWGVGPASRWVLFDVKEDPACQHDLTAAKPTLVATLDAAYDRWWDDVYPAMIQAGGDEGLPPSRIEPTWESMAENYRCPRWFQDGKIGVWMHWGIPSAIDENRPNDGSHYGRRMWGVEGYLGANEADVERTRVLSEWHAKRYGPPSGFGYEKLIPQFKAEKWDPDALVKFFKECGAHFVMPVATHHDNFDMYDSSHPWNSVAMGPKRDTIREWKEAASKHGLKFGVSTHLYWSPRFFNAARPYQKPGTPEWALFGMDYDPKAFSSQDSWNQHWYDRSWELIEKYDPDMFNNDSPYPDERPDRGKGLGVKLFSSFMNRDLKENGGKQTTVLSFKNARMNKAAFTYNLERGMFGETQKYPWMWATDLSGSWFYRKGAATRMSLPVLIGNAVDAISKNGVVMMNVALRGDGTLPQVQAEYLRAFGQWIEINGEGIYGTRPWKVFGEGPLVIETKRSGENLEPFSAADIRFTTKEDVLYAFVLAPPTEDIVIELLGNAGPLDGEIKSIVLLGIQEEVRWKRSAEALTIQLPKTLPDQPVIGFRISAE